MESPPPPPAPNLLQNPGLENPPPNTAPSCWQRTSFGSNIGFWSNTSDSHSGNNAEQVQISSYSDGDHKLISAQDPVSPNPSGLTATPSDSGGSLGPDTFYYKVTATTVWGETQASSEVSGTVNGAHRIGCIELVGLERSHGLPDLPRRRASGAETLLASIGTATTYTDTGAVTPGTATPPAMNTAVRWPRRARRRVRPDMSTG